MTVTPEPSIDELAEQLEALPAKPGTCVDATVSHVTDDWVYVTFEGGEGRAPIKPFGKAPMPGATVRLYVDDATEDGLQLSLDKAERLDLYARLEAAQADGTALRAEVLKVGTGGLAVQILGVKAFLPANMIDRRPGPLEDYLGQHLDVRILTLEGFKGRIEVAKADLPQESPEEAKARILGELQPGQMVEGVVRRLAPFGAFVDLGGFDGLIPTSELSWGRTRHPSEAVNVGDGLSLKVLSVDPAKARISLSLKAVLPDPWLTVEEQFPAGSVATGTVVGMAEYGVFVALAPGLEGLVHISEMRWGAAPKKPGSMVKRGASVQVRVVESDGARRRIRLSMKQAQDNPWDRIHADFPPGTRIRGEVRNVADFGVFIGVAEGVDGLVHASDVAWGRTVRDLSTRFRKGDTVEAMVLNVDVERQRLSLGIKQLKADDSDSLYDGIQPGNIIAGTVVKVVEFGAFVAVAEGLEGLVHRSEIADPEPASPKDALSPGDAVQVVVLSVDPDAGRISLSMKQVPDSPEEDLAPEGDALVSPPVSGLVPSAVPPPAAHVEAPVAEGLPPVVPPAPQAETPRVPPPAAEVPPVAVAPADESIVPPPKTPIAPTVEPTDSLVPAVEPVTIDTDAVPAPKTLPKPAQGLPETIDDQSNDAT